MKRSIKILSIASALAIILVLGVTMVMAQESDEPTIPETTEDKDLFQPSPHGRRPHGRMGFETGSMLDILSKALGMTSDEILGELQEGISIADLAASQGVDIETVINPLLEQARERIIEQINTPWTARAGFHGGGLVEILAEELDMTTDEVISELSAGISVADLAAEHGVDVQEIVDAFVASRQEALDQAVEAGRMTQEQADEMLEQMTERISEQVNEPWGSGDCGPGMMPGMRGHHGGGGGFPGSTGGQPSGFRGSVMQGTDL